MKLEKLLLLVIVSLVNGIKIYSSEMKDGVEIHNCGEINTGRRFVIFITVRNKIPYVTLSTSADTMFSFGF